MKKFLLLILTLVISISAFAIVDFKGVEWGNSKNAVAPMFNNIKPEPSADKNIQIYSASAKDENVKNYKLYFKNDHLYMIRVVFDNETVGRDELKQIYDKLNSTLGASISNRRFEEKNKDYKLTGNYIKFIPDAATTVYYIGIDTIDKDGTMVESNLYLDYTDTMNLTAPQLQF